MGLFFLKEFSPSQPTYPSSRSSACFVSSWLDGSAL